MIFGLIFFLHFVSSLPQIESAAFVLICWPTIVRHKEKNGSFFEVKKPLLFFFIKKSRLSLNSPSTLSENIVSLFNILPISYPIIIPPIAGDKIKSKSSGLFMIGGGVPKNFVQDTVVCAELLGKNVDMHKYAIQITVADSRDGACSSSTLKEASSWGKVDVTKEQMVFAEATSVLPLIVSDAYHNGDWKNRTRKNFSKIFG